MNLLKQQEHKVCKKMYNHWLNNNSLFFFLIWSIVYDF